MLEKLIEQFWKGKKNASPRDKMMLIIGMLLGLWFFYILISSLFEGVSSLEDSVSSDRELLMWMKSHAPLVQTAHATKQLSKKRTSQNILGVIESTLRANHLENSLTKSEQLPDQNIHLIFNQVAFDPLMAWLMQLRQSQNLDVKTFFAQSLNQPGSVNVELILSMT